MFFCVCVRESEGVFVFYNYLSRALLRAEIALLRWRTSRSGSLVKTVPKNKKHRQNDIFKVTKVLAVSYYLGCYV